MTYSVFAQKVVDRFPVYFRDSLQLDNIQPTFSKLTFREKGMGFAESCGDFFLQKTGIMPCFYQAL